MRDFLLAVNLVSPTDLGVDERDGDHVEAGHGVRPEVCLPPAGDCDIHPGAVVSVVLGQRLADISRRLQNHANLQCSSSPLSQKSFGILFNK